MTTKGKGRRPKIDWKFRVVDAGPMSEEDFERLCEIFAEMIYEDEMKKRQTQERGALAIRSHDVDPSREESAFLLKIS